MKFCIVATTNKSKGNEMLDKVEQAKMQWEVAQDKFNWAEGEDVEVATYQLLAAEKMYDRAVKIAKEEGVRCESYSTKEYIRWWGYYDTNGRCTTY